MKIKTLLWRMALSVCASIFLATLSTAADIDKGREIFNEHCVVCHTHIQGLMDKLGPNLYGLFNRQAGTASYRFSYSEPIARSGIEWVNLNLNLFLAAPARMVPGTKMVFRGLDDAGDRTNLICYLQHATNTGGQPISSDCEKLEN